MLYSNLVSYVNISPHKYKRTHPVDRITIHHMAGDATVEGCGSWFSLDTTNASANYGIGSDGRIGCYVPEDYRAVSSCSFSNDDRAINIEVANCSGDPDWKVSDEAFAALIDLCADICRRYGFRLHYTGDTAGNLTMHNWFAPTGCPGPYLMARFPEIAALVNERLGVAPEVLPYRPTALQWQRAAIEDGFDFPRYGADGIWGAECEAVAKKAVVKKRASYLYPNLTKLVQRVVGTEADGLCGPQTDAAIRAWQRAHGLTEDGAAGIHTYKEMLGVEG